jgi:hypothetical protein
MTRDAEATVRHAIVSAIAGNWHLAGNPPDLGAAEMTCDEYYRKLFKDGDYHK